MIMISDFLFNFINFWVIVSFWTKLLTLDILFSTVVRAILVAKLVILDIFTFNLTYISIKSSFSG